MVEQAGLRRRAVRRISALRVRSGVVEQTEQESVLVEEPLEIRVSGEPVATTLRTPVADRELALGYLFSEGAIDGLSNIASVAHCGRPGTPGFGNVIEVTPGPGLALPEDPLERLRPKALRSSACGACGHADIMRLAERASSLVEDTTKLSANQVLRCAAKLARTQQFFSATGGSHAAAVMTPEGRVSAAAEDVGRHNAVDKVVGSLLLRQQLPARGQLLVVSSRAGFEIVQKACVAQIPIVVCLSAPTTLAVETARRTSMTLVGFVRRGGFNVYSGESRLWRGQNLVSEPVGPRVAYPRDAAGNSSFGAAGARHPKGASSSEEEEAWQR